VIGQNRVWQSWNKNLGHVAPEFLLSTPILPALHNRDNYRHVLSTSDKAARLVGELTYPVQQVVTIILPILQNQRHTLGK
jgi:hypothetical protein